MKTMKKYLSLLVTFFKISLVADLEYRLNSLLHIFMNLLWFVVQIVGFEVIYLHTSDIGGWSIHQTRVMLAIVFTVDSLYTFFVEEGLSDFFRMVQRGDLDLLLTKPVNSQFMISFQKMKTPSLFNVFLMLGYLAWTLTQLPNFTWTRGLLLLALIPNSFLILYSMRFIFISAVVMFAKAENLLYIWFNLYRLSFRPDGILFSWVRWTLLTIIPFSLVANVPARILFEKSSAGLTIYTFFMGFALLYLSHRFWIKSLKNYSSASS